MSPHTKPRVALVTCAVLPEPDPDQELMLGALRSAGLEASMLAWDEDGADPGAFDLCVLRSCWNYHAKPERFLRWIDGAGAKTKLLNPAGVVRWNLHKRYLRDMEAAGLPIVPTAFVDRGSTRSLADTLREREWGDVVVKPCISAGSANTRRFRPGEHDAGEGFLSELVRDRDVMIQPYLPSVESGGERSVICIDGRATHAIEKSPRFHGQDESVSEAKAVTTDERAMLDRALSLVAEPLLYARLDTMLGPDGQRLISEFELIEPSLFFLQSAQALDAFVGGVVDGVHSR